MEPRENDVVPMYIFPKTEEIEDVTTQYSEDHITAIIQQVRLTPYEDKKKHHGNDLDNKSTYRDIQEILYALIEPLAPNGRKEYGKTQY